MNALIEALAQGPEDDTLAGLLPEDFAVLSSRIEEKVCYLNISGETPLPEDETQRALLFASLENSILSLSGVEQVQFLVEGESAPLPAHPAADPPLPQAS